MWSNTNQYQNQYGQQYTGGKGGKGYYEQGNWGTTPGKGGYGQAIPEIIRTGSGYSYRGDQKIKLIVDAPIGDALFQGRADIEALPIEHMNRLREVIKLIPLAASEEDWTAWKALASQGGKVYPGKSIEDLWMHSGMPLNRKKSLESVTSDMTQLFQQQNEQHAAMLQAQQESNNTQINALTAQIGTLAAALQSHQNNNGADAPAPKRRVRPRH